MSVLLLLLDDHHAHLHLNELPGRVLHTELCTDPCMQLTAKLSHRGTKQLLLPERHKQSLPGSHSHNQQYTGHTWLSIAARSQCK